jgi:hypothetical protein
MAKIIRDADYYHFDKPVIIRLRTTSDRNGRSSQRV